jgi:hypothetical protein
MTNAINVICPYKYDGTWVFDDPKHGLVREPFVAGTDEIRRQLVSVRAIGDGGLAMPGAASILSKCAEASLREAGAQAALMGSKPSEAGGVDHV